MPAFEMTSAKRLTALIWIAICCVGADVSADEEIETLPLKSPNILTDEFDPSVGNEERANAFDHQNNIVRRESKQDKIMRSLIKRLLLSAEAGQEQTKRACVLNLGGHCATDNAVAMAEQWAYLKSHLSPGRRRRRAVADPRSAQHSPGSKLESAAGSLLY